MLTTVLLFSAVQDLDVTTDNRLLYMSAHVSTVCQYMFNKLCQHLWTMMQSLSFRRSFVSCRLDYSNCLPTLRHKSKFLVQEDNYIRQTKGVNIGRYNVSTFVCAILEVPKSNHRATLQLPKKLQ